MGRHMNGLVAIALGFVSAASVMAPVRAEEERPPALSCDVGPLHRNYGKTDWLVYSCDDTRSVVVVSAEGNPAIPFYFIVYVEPDGTMKLYGEGNGDKSASEATYDELKQLFQSDVAALVVHSQAVSGR